MHANVTNPLQAVIFDVDGTLADTEGNGHRVAFNQAFEKLGLGWHWTPELYGQLLSVTGGKERLCLYVGTYAREMLDQPDFDAWVSRVYRLKSEIYTNLVLAGNIPLRPGVARLIGELRAAGVRLAIATTTAATSLNSLIRANFKCDMASLFEVICAGDQVARKKPAPDAYQWVLDRLGLPASACLAIEDSSIGLNAARGAGLRTIVTTSPYTADEDFDGALSIVSDLGEFDTPARHIGGLKPATGCIDLAQLRAWQRQASNSPAQ
jgi:HAD superfamily hydrolase (TIGR01509 family)